MHVLTVMTCKLNLKAKQSVYKMYTYDFVLKADVQQQPVNGKAMNGYLPVNGIT